MEICLFISDLEQGMLFFNQKKEHEIIFVLLYEIIIF